MVVREVGLNGWMHGCVCVAADVLRMKKKRGGADDLCIYETDDIPSLYRVLRSHNQ